jgi:hypothetical protein
MTSPGLIVSGAAVGEILNQLRGTAVPANAEMVLDLFGTSSAR